MRATCHQVPQLLDWTASVGERTWAIESADRHGYLLSQQLIAAHAAGAMRGESGRSLRDVEMDAAASADDFVGRCLEAGR